ncbi:MAG: hypothetical protein IJQ67_07450 [Bacilli bacterium]|nr:hypothetical protein [Bacilli bacterium]
MKKYTLEAVVDGQTIKFSKKFDSRNSAINFMFNYYNKRYMFNIRVNDEYAISGDKHNIEYVCDYSNRFRINRLIIAE